MSSTRRTRKRDVSTSFSDKAEDGLSEGTGLPRSFSPYSKYPQKSVPSRIVCIQSPSLGNTNGAPHVPPSFTDWIWVFPPLQPWQATHPTPHTQHPAPLDKDQDLLERLSISMVTYDFVCDDILPDCSTLPHAHFLPRGKISNHSKYGRDCCRSSGPTKYRLKRRRMNPSQTKFS